MTCTQVEPQLVAYHFGLVEVEARAELEAHLVACGACLRVFLDLKRAIETGEDEPAPSPAARARLRRAVESEVAPPRKRRWELPLALAAAATLLLVARATTHGLTSGPGMPPYAMSAGRAPK